MTEPNFAELERKIKDLEESNRKIREAFRDLFDRASKLENYANAVNAASRNAVKILSDKSNISNTILKNTEERTKVLEREMDILNEKVKTLENEQLSTDEHKREYTKPDSSPERAVDLDSVATILFSMQGKGAGMMM
jgi:prefoldin subunit 5